MIEDAIPFTNKMPSIEEQWIIIHNVYNNDFHTMIVEDKQSVYAYVKNYEKDESKRVIDSKIGHERECEILIFYQYNEAVIKAQRIDSIQK